MSHSGYREGCGVTQWVERGPNQWINVGMKKGGADPSKATDVT